MYTTLDVLRLERRRIKKFLQIAEGAKPSELASDPDISKSGSYKFIKEFMGAGLIMRASDNTGNPEVVLTEKGKKVAPMVRAIEREFEKIAQVDEEYRAEDAKRELESIVSVVSLDDVEKIVRELRLKQADNASRRRETGGSARTRHRLDRHEE
ncbi:MAG: hypothetical protein QW767_03920 [Thermoprotei archaeon]